MRVDGVLSMGMFLASATNIRLAWKKNSKLKHSGLLIHGRDKEMEVL